MNCPVLFSAMSVDADNIRNNRYYHVAQGQEKRERLFIRAHIMTRSLFQQSEH